LHSGKHNFTGSQEFACIAPLQLVYVVEAASPQNIPQRERELFSGGSAMSILSRLWHRDDPSGTPEEEERIDATIERILTMIPRLRMARRYRTRLAAGVTAYLRFETAMLASLPAARPASINTWSSDPHLRAFFATPEDLTAAFGRSEALREYFDRHPESEEAYAVLGMAMTERHVLGVAMEGDTIRRDVAQTTICFGDYRVRICADTEANLHREIGKRLVDQLALEGLAKLAADRRDLQSRGHELIEERFALFQTQGAGMRSVAGGGDESSAQELARLHAAIEDNADKLAALKAPTEVIELEFERVCEVLSESSTHIYLTKKQLCIDLMNVVQPAGARGSHDIEFNFARIPGSKPEQRAFAVVRYSRHELLPAGLHIDPAIRAL
jgi:hypothetical protein